MIHGACFMHMLSMKTNTRKKGRKKLDVPINHANHTVDRDQLLWAGLFGAYAKEGKERKKL